METERPKAVPVKVWIPAEVWEPFERLRAQLPANERPRVSRFVIDGLRRWVEEREMQAP